MRKLVAGDPSSVEQRTNLARALGFLADTQLKTGDPASAGNQWDQAADEWRQVLRIKFGADDAPSRALRVEAHNSLAWTLLMRGKPALAGEEASKGQVISPENTDLRLNLAHARLLGDSFDEAARLYAACVRERPDLLAIIHSDFADFRAAGHDHSDMKKIEAKFPVPETTSGSQPSTAPA
jgi:hypothetical protein